MAGLEGHLRAGVGDFIVLKRVIPVGSTDTVGGFVREVTPISVRLSHENPNNRKLYRPFMRGDRSYRLKDFDSCQVFEIDYS